MHCATLMISLHSIMSLGYNFYFIFWFLFYLLAFFAQLGWIDYPLFLYVFLFTAHFYRYDMIACSNTTVTKKPLMALRKP